MILARFVARPGKHPPPGSASSLTLASFAALPLKGGGDPTAESGRQETWRASCLS